MSLLTELEAHAPEYIEWRHTFHEHPELGLETPWTADLVAAKLRSFGIEVTQGVGGHGVVGVLEGSLGPGRTVGLRSDMDALSITETERFPVDELYGFHNWTDVPVGEVRCRKGATMAGQDFFAIRVKGKGAHASAPQLSADAALAAAMITTALQQIVSRNIAPLDSAVVSVTKIHTGSAFNIIPETAEVGGCTRFFSDETGALIRERIEAVTKATAESVGCRAEVEFTPVAAVLNSNARLAEELLAAAREVVGDEKASFADIPQMASEDFSYLAREVPGAYGFLGGQAPYGASNLHNPQFDFDDRVLSTGAALWVTIARRRLAAS